MYNNLTNRVPTAYHKEPADIYDVIAKAYAAGTMTRAGNLIIYGTGANAGTNWTLAAIVELVGVENSKSLNAATWFTNVYNDALRNRAKTNRKHTFYLTQLEEITPVLEWFGMEDVFRTEWDRIRAFDEHCGLPSVMQEINYIPDWESNTVRTDISFMEREIEIMEAVTNRIMERHAELLRGVDNPVDMLQCVFIEGQRALSYHRDETPILMAGRSLASQYVA
jgi:hypothetical protein